MQLSGHTVHNTPEIEQESEHEKNQITLHPRREGLRSSL